MRTNNHRDVKAGTPLPSLGLDRAGASAVEFALVVPMFLALLAGTIETGHVFYVQSELTSTAREAARRLATDLMTDTEAETFVRSQFPHIPTASMAVQIAEVDLGSGRTDLTVDVSVPIAEVALLNLTELLPNDLSLEASATMVKE